MGHKLPYDSLHDIRCRLEEVSPSLTRYGEVEEANYFKQAADLAQVCTTCCDIMLDVTILLYCLKHLAYKIIRYVKII